MNIYKLGNPGDIMLPDTSAIKNKRKKVGLTQNALAKEAGISQSLLAKLESGKTEASYEKVKRIFEILDRTEKKDEKKAGDIMTKAILRAKPNDIVGDVTSKMKKHSISQMPVFLGSKQVGSISETSIIARMDESKDIHKMLVKDIMDNPLPTAGKDVSVNSLLPLLKEAGAILILDKSLIVGIVTKVDVI